MRSAWVANGYCCSTCPVRQPRTWHSARARKRRCRLHLGFDSLLADIRDQVSRALEGLSPNPLQTGPETEPAEDPYLQAEMDDDDFPE